MANLGKQGKKFAGKTASRLIEDIFKDDDDDIIDEIVRAAAAGVGVVSEAIKYQKEKKALQQGKAVLDHDAQEQRDTSGITHELPSSAARPGLETRDSGVEDMTTHVHEVMRDLDAVDEEQETVTDVAPSQSKELKEKKKNKKNKKKNALGLADEFIERYPFSPPGDPDAPRAKLAQPVILAQRRPKTRSRGFVRAYAPVLADVGIDQECFLNCIDALNLSMVPNEWLHAINLAGFADIILMEPLLMLAGMALQLATDAAIEAQSRHRSNKFLDRVNAEFFAPRGLVAFVATWRPNSTEQLISMDFEGKMAPSDKQPSKNTGFMDKLKELDRMTSSKEVQRRMLKQIGHKIRPHSGPIGGLEPAPLVFPAVESSINVSNEGGLDDNGQTKKKKKKAISRAGDWLDEHIDRHAQAKWREENSELAMAQMLPAPQFRSRYADPNHPAASGSLVDLVTGGKWALGKKKTVIKGEELETLRQQSDSSDDSSDDEETRVRKRERKWRKREERERMKMEKKERDSVGWMSLIKTDALYLVVFNMPTEEEMQVVRQYMHGDAFGSEQQQEEA